MRSARAASLLGLALAASAAARDLTLPALIGDNMVLQRSSQACIWGWADPGQEVVVGGLSAGGGAGDEPVPHTARADERGRWAVYVPTGDAGGPYSMTIRAGASSITLTNIMVGEVWLCSGQSNMEWPLAAIGEGTPAVPGAETEILAAKHPAIRLFTVPNTISVHERIDVDGGAWQECTPVAAAPFSAVGYFFGRELHQRLGVPVGLIQADWGGTRIQAWMRDESLAALGEAEGDLRRITALRRGPADRAAEAMAAAGDWWSRLDAGVDPAWGGTEFDDSGWGTTAVPATWGGDLGGFDGVVYFRTAFDAPEALAGQACVLELGPIDDYDDAWVNGVHVGATHADDQWSRPRRYELPPGVIRSGRNVLAVRVLDSAGPGGINGTPDQLVLHATEGDAKVALAGEWRWHRGASSRSLPSRDAQPDLHQNTPTLAYNAMIAPLTPYTIRGVAWYQGESNRADAARYASLFPAMIRDWRDTWAGGRGGNDQWKENREFPFYFAQVSAFRYPGDAGETSLLREAQGAALKLPNTGMAVTLDLGEHADIHPPNKLDVGRRLALLALARTYGVKDLVDSGPMYGSLKIEGGKAHVRFDSAHGGLVARHGLTGFTIAGTDQQFHTAHAEIEGDTVVVSSPRVAEPVAVRYAWTPSPAASLFNAGGLPAAPFRTDEWDDAPLAVEDDGQTVYLSGDRALKPLFNGTDLAGWVNVNCSPDTWSARNGRIYCTGSPTGVLRTAEMYQNFVLDLEWRHLKPGGNAGLFVWSDALTARGQPFTRSVEVQVMDGLEGEGYTSDGDIFPIHGARMTPENGRPGSDRAFPTQRRARFSPEWNHYRVECVDGAITLAVNGKVVSRGTDITPRRGYICLESEGSPVEFRNIRIKTLPSSGYLAPEQVASADEGFVALYNGKDLSGWKSDAYAASNWRAQDWTLNFTGQGADLWSEKSYKDFVLIADWRWIAPPKDVELPMVLPDGLDKKNADGTPATQHVQDAGDSGIYLRGSTKAQVNMWCWPIGSGEVHGYRADEAQPDAVRAAATPKSRADAPIGRWNRFVITMKGDRLTVDLNGVTVIDRAPLPGVPEEGPIALQSHGSPVQFANIYIKELK